MIMPMTLAIDWQKIIKKEVIDEEKMADFCGDAGCCGRFFIAQDVKRAYWKTVGRLGAEWRVITCAKDYIEK
jgi:hypothetical protein